MKSLILVICSFVLLFNVHTEQELKVNTEFERLQFEQMQMTEQEHYQSMYMADLFWRLYSEQNAMCFDLLRPYSKTPILRETF